jgi:hypothetical protein
MSFLVWRPGTMKDGICQLRDVQGVEDSFEIDEGVSRLDGWPAGAFAAMDPDFPKDIGLADSLYGAGFVVVSGNARRLLDAQGVNHVEFLPIRIVNHKGRKASDDYFIVNPLDVCDCIDLDASGVKWNAIDPESLSGCKKLVLREGVIPPEYKLFRLGSWKNVIVIRRGLADRMLEAKLSGLMFIEPHEYTGLI